MVPKSFRNLWLLTKKGDLESQTPEDAQSVLDEVRNVEKVVHEEDGGHKDDNIQNVECVLGVDSEDGESAEYIHVEKTSVVHNDNGSCRTYIDAETPVKFDDDEMGETEVHEDDNEKTS